MSLVVRGGGIREPERQRQTGPPSRYVALSHWMMRTAAWRCLDTVARCAYIELAKRYGGPGCNNGRIPCTVREIAEALNIGKMTAHRALASLQEHGFIVLVKKGHFDFKLKHATEWRLTEFGCDVTATSQRRTSPAGKKKTRYRHRTRTGSEMIPHGFCNDTRQTPKWPLRYRHRTRECLPRYHHRYTSSLPGRERRQSAGRAKRATTERRSEPGLSRGEGCSVGQRNTSEKVSEKIGPRENE